MADTRSRHKRTNNTARHRDSRMAMAGLEGRHEKQSCAVHERQRVLSEDGTLHVV